jgi:hypothetical protein
VRDVSEGKMCVKVEAEAEVGFEDVDCATYGSRVSVGAAADITVEPVLLVEDGLGTISAADEEELCAVDVSTSFAHESRRDRNPVPVSSNTGPSAR